MKPKPSFKLTEIGWIPEDWEVIRLGEILYVKSGFSFKSKDFVENGIPVIRISDIKDEKVQIDNSVCFPEMKKLEDFLVKKYDILIAMSGATTGKIGIYNHEKLAYLNQRVGKFIIYDKNKVSSIFISQLVRTENFAKQLQNLLEQGAQPNISCRQIESLIFAIPKSINEQHAIATVLSDVDKLIETLDELIEKKQAIKKATMHLLLTGKKRLPGFDTNNKFKKTEIGCIPEDWEVKKLGEILYIKSGFSFKSKDFVENGIPVIRISDIKDEKVQIDKSVCFPEMKKLEEFLVKKYDILIAMSGATTGKIGIYNHEKFAYLNQRVGKFIIYDKNKVSSFFISQLVRTENFTKQLQNLLEQGAQPNVSCRQIESLIFAIPKSTDEQHAIAQVLSDMDSEIEALQAKRDKLKQLKQGMMQVLLTGKIRLVETSKEAEV